MAKGRKFKVCAALGLALALLLAGAWLARRPLLEGVGRRLIRDEGAAGKSRTVYLLLGDRTGMRGYRALAALQDGLAGEIAYGTDGKDGLETEGFAPNDAEVHNALYRARGVAPERIVQLPCLVTSTKDEAECFLAHAKSGPKVEQIYVVTSWYHSARAGWIFDRVFAGSGIAPRILAAELPRHNPSNWWHDETSFLHVFAEFLKWTYYLLKY